MVEAREVTLWQWHDKTWNNAGLAGDNTTWDNTTTVELGVTESLQRLVYRSACATLVYQPFENPVPVPLTAALGVLITVANGQGVGETVLDTVRWIPWRNGFVDTTSLGGIFYWTGAESPIFERDFQIRRAAGIELAHTVTINVREYIFGMSTGHGGAAEVFPNSDAWSSLMWLTADTSVP